MTTYPDRTETAYAVAFAALIQTLIECRAIDEDTLQSNLEAAELSLHNAEPVPTGAVQVWGQLRLAVDAARKDLLA